MPPPRPPRRAAPRPCRPRREAPSGRAPKSLPFFSGAPLKGQEETARKVSCNACGPRSRRARTAFGRRRLPSIRGAVRARARKGEAMGMGPDDDDVLDPPEDDVGGALGDAPLDDDEVGSALSDAPLGGDDEEGGPLGGSAAGSELGDAPVVDEEVSSALAD